MKLPFAVGFEPRAVLKNKNVEKSETRRSSPSALTVLPAYGSQKRKNTPVAEIHSDVNLEVPMERKRIVSWAEIASK